MSDRAVVVMYSRRICGLCDKARAVILAERDGMADPFVFEERTIDGDDDLELRYGIRVPVVEVDGREEFEIAVEPLRLRRLVAR